MPNDPLSSQELARIQGATAPCNIHLETFLAKEFKQSLSNPFYYQQVDIQPDRINEFSDTLNDIARKQRKFREENDLGISILKANQELIKGAIAIGIASAPVTGGSSTLLLAGFGYLAEKALDYVEEEAKSALQEQSHRNLRTLLDKYERDSSPDELQRLLSQRDYNEFRRELENRVGPILGNALADLPSDEQYIVNNYYNKVLAKAVQDGFQAVANAQQLQENEIENNRQNIISLARTFTHFAESNQKQLNTILVTQQELKAGIEQINNRLDQTQQGVGFIQEFMFGKMTPSEQLNALKMGVFPGMDASKRQELQSQIELTEKREQLTKTMAGYLNGAADIVNIARNLGVNPDLLRTAEVGVNVGVQVFNAVSSFASGNYLGAVSSLTNMLGLFGGGRDIAGERHQQTIDMLKGLYDQLGVIDQKITFLIDGQQHIMQSQQIIFEAIQDLTKQVQENHQQILERFQELTDAVLYNRVLIRSAFQQDYDRCYDLVNIDNHPIIDTSNKQYPNYNEFVRLYRNNRRSFDVCVNRLESTRANDQFNPPIFWLQSYEGVENSGIRNYIAKVYKPAVDFLKINLPITQKTLEARISSLLSPMGDIESLKLKIQIVENSWQRRFRLPFVDLLQVPLYPTAIQMHVEYVLNIHFYYQLINPDTSRPYTLNELIELPDVPTTGKDDLIEAQCLVDIAIAQQTLLNGDFLLPMMAEVFRQYDETPSPSEDVKKWYESLINLVKNNSILARNFLVYKLREEVLSKTCFANYAIALGCKDPYMLKRITTSRWAFYWNEQAVIENNIIAKPKGWAIKLNDKYFALPSADELLEGKLLYSPDVYMLLNLRSRVIDELNSYSFFDSINENKRLRFNEVILNSV